MKLTIIAIQPFEKVVVHRRPLIWRQLVLKNLPRDKANRKRRNIWMNNKTVYINKIELHNHCTKHAFIANNKLDAAIFTISLRKPTAYRPVQFAIEAIANLFFDFFFLKLSILLIMKPWKYWFFYSFNNYYCHHLRLLTTRYSIKYSVTTIIYIHLFE